mgnify:FL=1
MTAEAPKELSCAYHFLCVESLKTNTYFRSQRPGFGADQGFMLKFTGGEGGRLSDIEFICDKTQNPGTLQAKNPAEQPEHDYHLKWTTTFACPGGGDGDGDGGKGGDGDDGPAISGGWIFIIM